MNGLQRTRLIFTALAVMALAAGGQAQESTTPAAEALYVAKCAACHGPRGWATRVLARRVPEGQAELTRREGLPAAYTSVVVRRGVGSMPPFTPTDLSDAQVAEIAAWLATGPAR